MNDKEYRVDYEPAESKSGLFGGNSNWRGPIWFPVNYLLIESLQKFHWYYGEDFKVEFPTGSEKMLNLWEVSQELSRRLSHIFLQDTEGTRPFNGNVETFQTDEFWKDYILFYEYFHGDNGSGVGRESSNRLDGISGEIVTAIGRIRLKSSLILVLFQCFSMLFSPHYQSIFQSSPQLNAIF